MGATRTLSTSGSHIVWHVLPVPDLMNEDDDVIRRSPKTCVPALALPSSVVFVIVACVA